MAGPLDLPEDVLQDILMRVVKGAAPEHVTALLCVCSRFKSVLQRACATHDTIARPFPNQPLLIRDCAGLKSLAVYGERMLPLLPRSTGLFEDRLSSLPLHSLSKLTAYFPLSESSIPDWEEIEHIIIASPNLETLVLRHAPNAMLTCLEGLSVLRSLSICCASYYGPNDDELAVNGNRYMLNVSKYSRIARLTSLRSLTINGAYELTNAGLMRLTALSDLTHLQIGGCDEDVATDAGLNRLLQHLPALRDLGISGVCVLDAGLSHVQRLSLLTALDIDDARQVTDDGVSYLSSLHSLASLRMNLCDGFCDGGVEHLAACPSLKSLTLIHCALSRSVISHLAKLTKLTHLCLFGSSVPMTLRWRVSSASLSCAFSTSVGAARMSRMPVSGASQRSRRSRCWTSAGVG